MDVRFVALDLARIDTLRYEALALPLFADERPPRGAVGLCDWRLCGHVSQTLARGWITGALGEVALMPVRARLPFDKLALFGLGARAAFDRAVYESTVVRMLTTLAGLRLRTFVVALPGRASGELPPGDAIRWFLTAAFERSDDFDEIVVLDDPEAQRAMLPVVDAEKRRLRAARDIASD